MINIRKYKTTFLVGISLFINVLIYCQNKDNLWVIGVGVNAVDYFPSQAVNTGNNGGFLDQLFNANEHWNISAPYISVTRHLKGKLSIDGSVAFNKIKKYGIFKVESTTYIGLDVNLRYGFLDPYKNFNIFALVGGGYTFVFNSGGTLNGGFGLNYWFNDTLGLQTQFFYKYNSTKFNLAPHFFYSLSLVFNLNSSKNFNWRG